MSQKIQELKTHIQQEEKKLQVLLKQVEQQKNIIASIKRLLDMMIQDRRMGHI